MSHLRFTIYDLRFREEARLRLAGWVAEQERRSER